MTEVKDDDFYERAWTAADDRSLDEMAAPLTLEHFRLLLKARGCSEGVDQAEPPSQWMPTLLEEYSLGPLDKAGVPLRFRRSIN